MNKFTTNCTSAYKKERKKERKGKMLKQSNYRSGQALRVPGG
jgi:hypothetical protein